MKVEIIKDRKAFNKFDVKMELTEGAILALKHSLEANTSSPVAQDLLLFLKSAGDKAGIKW